MISHSIRGSSPRVSKGVGRRNRSLLPIRTPSLTVGLLPHPGSSKLQRSPRHHHRGSAHTHFFNFAGLAFHFQANPAGPINEIALFDHKLVNTIRRINSRRVMMDQVTSQWPSRAASRWIFTDAHADKESRMRARFTNLHRLASEGIASGPAAKDFAPLKNVIEQILQ